MREPFLDRFVPGKPAPFATAGERPWKDAITAELGSATPDRRAAFLELDFTVAPAIGYARGADLDNFCEPMFSVLANRLGWFGGSRPNVRAFRARKALGTPTGCRVRIYSERWQDTWIDGAVLLDGVASGALPVSARDDKFAGWVRETMLRPGSSSGLFGVELRFTGPVNLGDIATGRLKNVIDCHYPVLGGRPGAPNDAQVAMLEATRMATHLRGAVHIRVTESSR
jgi:hypothetical protein